MNWNLLRTPNLGLLIIATLSVQTTYGFSLAQPTFSRQVAQNLATTTSASATTKLYSSSPETNDDDADDSMSDDPFMASLRKRMDQVSDRATKLPLVVLDSMLPRQVLKLQVQNPVFMELIRSVVSEEEPRFGMLGLARLANGQYVHLKDGVEVQIEGTPEMVNDGKNDGISLTLKAVRRFRIKDSVKNVKQGWTEARVEFLNSKDEELKEEQMGEDRLSLARAMSKARAFTHANSMHVEEKDVVLVDRWVELAKENEREQGQIDRLLDDLGEIPPSEQPTERAFWIGALINPIPAMGVAMEIRPALLTSKTAEERVQVALDGIVRSIKHMDGTKRMW